MLTARIASLPCSTPHQAQQMKLLQQQQDMAGQRPQSPGSMDNAPSPKRQRVEGNGFNGQAMGPAGRGQGVPGHPGANAQMLMQNGQLASMSQAELHALAAQNPQLQKNLEVSTAMTNPNSRLEQLDLAWTKY